MFVSSAASVSIGRDGDLDSFLSVDGSGARVQYGLRDAVDAAEVAQGRKTVDDAMRADSSMVRRLAFMLAKGCLAPKATKKGIMSPSCSNKYTSMGIDRSRVMFMCLVPSLDRSKFQLMKLDDLKVVIRYVLVCISDCHVACKVCAELLAQSKQRYDTILGGIRLNHIICQVCEDSKFKYTDVDYAFSGCFNFRMKGKANVDAVIHCNGTIAKLVPPMDANGLYIHNNHIESKATIMSRMSVGEINVMKLSITQKNVEHIPKALDDQRVGSSTLEMETPVRSKNVFAIANEPFSADASPVAVAFAASPVPPPPAPSSASASQPSRPRGPPARSVAQPPSRKKQRV